MKLRKNTRTLRVKWFTIHASVKCEENEGISKKITKN